MPSTQRTIDKGEASEGCFKTIENRKCSPSLLAKFASNDPVETAQLSRRSTAPFPDRVRKFTGESRPRALPPTAHLPHFAQLTRREREIVQLICDGQSNQEIADETGSSLATVKQHTHSIFGKLEVTSRSRLIALMR